MKSGEKNLPQRAQRILIFQILCELFIFFESKRTSVKRNVLQKIERDKVVV